MRNRTHNKVWRRYEGKRNQVQRNDSGPRYKAVAMYGGYSAVADTHANNELVFKYQGPDSYQGCVYHALMLNDQYASDLRKGADNAAS